MISITNTITFWYKSRCPRLRRFLGVFTGIHAMLVMVDQIEPIHIISTPSPFPSDVKNSPRNQPHLQLTPRTVPRRDTLQVRTQVRLAVQRFTSGSTGGEFACVFGDFGLVRGETHESDYGG